MTVCLVCETEEKKEKEKKREAEGDRISDRDCDAKRSRAEWGAKRRWQKIVIFTSKNTKKGKNE